MLPEKKNNTYIGVIGGFLLSAVGRGLATQGESMAMVGGLLTLAGAVVFIWGCVNLAQGKGYSGWLGALGLLSCIGLLILVVIPDKNKVA